MRLSKEAPGYWMGPNLSGATARDGKPNPQHAPRGAGMWLSTILDPAQRLSKGQLAGIGLPVGGWGVADEAVVQRMGEATARLAGAPGAVLAGGLVVPLQAVLFAQELEVAKEVFYNWRAFTKFATGGGLISAEEQLEWARRGGEL